MSDGEIFNKSLLKKAIEENLLDIPQDAVILGDEAFPLKSYLMIPYARCNILTKKEKNYNFRHCRARRIRIVENAFGILGSRFKLFRRPIPLAPPTVVKITKAACSLNNFIRKSVLNQYLKSVDIEDLANGCIIPRD